MVFFFYPKDFTPGCTKEACGFRDNYDAFEKLNCKVFGVSSDSEKRHLLFAKKFNLNFDLITDNGNQLATLFEVKRNLFGLIPGRVTFIFDERGVCKGSFNSMRDAEGHIKYALNCLKELQ
jgi:peroxiredoxin Q/BCP